ncbi:MAG: hypothetical protein R3B13_31685 [Polyangiaceae bacterium]
MRGLPYLLLLAAACGSRSGLEGLRSRNPASGGSGTGGAASGGMGAQAGSAGSAGLGGGGGTPLPDCLYTHTDTVEVFDWGDGLRAPLLATLGGGSESERAEVAVAATHEHFWHPDIRVAKVSFDSGGLSKLSVDRSMTVYGIDSHATGTLATNETGGLDLFYYHADEASPNVIPGVKFRRFDATTWKPLPEVTMENEASFAFGFALGPGLSGAGGYAGSGRFLVWRSALVAESVVETRVAMADQTGLLTSKPLLAAGPGSYSQFGAAVAWSGSDYLLASNELACDPGTCNGGISIKRIVPSATQLGLESTSSFPTPAPLKPRTPQLDSDAGNAFAAWRETGETQQDAQRLRVATLDVSGHANGPEHAYDTQSLAGPVLKVSDQGALVIYAETADPSLPASALGHGRLALRQHGKSGETLQSLELPSTELTFGTPYALAPIRSPRGMLIAWTGASVSGHPTPVLYLSFLACSAAE